MIYFLLILMALPFAWQSDAGKPYRVSVQLDSQEVALDDFIKMKVEFHFPRSYQVDVERLLHQLEWSANPLAPPLKVDHFSLSSLTTKGNEQSQLLEVTLSPLVTGDISLWLREVHFTPIDSNLPSEKVSTPLFLIKIKEASTQFPLPYASLIPLEPQFPLGLSQENRQFLWENHARLEKENNLIQEQLQAHHFPWLTLAILIGLGGVGWTAYLSKERWPKKKAKPVPPQALKEKMLKSLTGLQEQELLNTEQFSLYYSELSSIFLAALEQRLGKKTAGLTTPELTKVLDVKNREEIVSIFSALDQVKFAGQKPSKEEAKQLFIRVQELVLLYSQ